MDNDVRNYCILVGGPKSPVSRSFFRFPTRYLILGPEADFSNFYLCVHQPYINELRIQN